MSYKSILLLLASGASAATSAAVFRLALKGNFSWRGSIGHLVVDTCRLLVNPTFLLGLVVFGIANMLWLLVLGSQKLSVAYPVQIGLVLVLNSLISAAFFNEYLTLHGYIGVLFVILGLFLIVQ
jgi:multidrug transporter EmrE-like cation transporter